MAFVFKKINKSIDKCKKSTTVNNNNNKDNNAITNHSLLERTKRTLERKKKKNLQFPVLHRLASQRNQNTEQIQENNGICHLLLMYNGENHPQYRQAYRLLDRNYNES